MHTLRLSPVSFILHPWERLGYPLEQLLHVMAEFGTRLDEHKSILLRLLFALCSGDFTLIVQIRLVAHEDNNDIVPSLSPHIVNPLPRILEGFGIRNVIYNDGYAGVTNVGWNEGSETFLASGIPQLEPDGSVLEVHRL